MLEQQGGDAPVVHVVGHRERDLGGVRVVSEQHVAGHADHLAVATASSAALPGAGFPQIRRASISAERRLMLKNRM